MCHEGVLNKDCDAKVMLWEMTKSRSCRGVGKDDERMGVARTQEGRKGEASYRRSNGPGEKAGDLDSPETEPFSASFWSPVETRGRSVQVERLHQDRRMTKGAGRVQNRGVTMQWAVKERLDVQSYGWKCSRFWPQKRSFSASIPQVLIF